MSAKNPFPVSHWPQQSPIKIFKKDSLYVKFPKSYLSIDYKDAPFAGCFVGERGHINFELTKPHPGPKPPMIVLGGVKAELVKIHLHTPSEHDIEGKNHDGEIHLIHKIVDPIQGSELIVLGIFFSKDTKAKQTEFFSTWTTELKASKKGGSKDSHSIMIDPNKLLPLVDKWYRYEGSLTSEPYGEVVSWIVFDGLLGISSSDLTQLKKEAHQPERPTQDINRRFVIRNFA